MFHVDVWNRQIIGVIGYDVGEILGKHHIVNWESQWLGLFIGNESATGFIFWRRYEPMFKNLKWDLNWDINICFILIISIGT